VNAHGVPDPELEPLLRQRVVSLMLVTPAVAAPDTFIGRV
jgi:hypothetical protein